MMHDSVCRSIPVWTTMRSLTGKPPPPLFSVFEEPPSSISSTKEDIPCDTGREMLYVYMVKFGLPGRGTADRKFTAGILDCDAPHVSAVPLQEAGFRGLKRIVTFLVVLGEPFSRT